MVRSFAILCLAFSNVGEAAVTAGKQTCAHLKESYKTNACCGSPKKEVGLQIVPNPVKRLKLSTNPCAGKKPKAGTGFDNIDCVQSGIIKATEQAGADVSASFMGTMNVSGRYPITDAYWKKALCAVNVHWHLGAEHKSAGQYDETGKGPLKAGTPAAGGRRLASNVRYGFACKHYNKDDAKFTTAYKWKHCVGMHVGETYEVHWPHSALGKCNTPFQFQTPFYDGVFCNWVNEVHSKITPQQLAHSVGVQAQVFTIVNDEDYYYPDLMRGMIVDGNFGKDVAAYTGSTTGTTRNNKICSKYTPITWQVDRKCHLISASSFDKMCADMMQQNDDMTHDIHAHGARELVWQNLTANNLRAGPTR